MKMCLAYLGVFLLALHLSSQVVQAQNTTMEPMNMTMYSTMASNSTNSQTTMSKDNGSGRTDAFTLLLPLALVASLLHDWS